jgi:hypothetical protein
VTTLLALVLAVAWVAAGCWRISRRQAEGAHGAPRIAPVDGLLARLQDMDAVGAGELDGSEPTNTRTTVAAEPSIGAVIRSHAATVRRPLLVALAGPALLVALALAPPTTIARGVAWYAVLFAPAWVAGFAYWTREERVGPLRAIGLGHAFVVYSLHWIASAWLAVFGRGVNDR